MTSTEWSPVDTPSSACAPDLFGGELFGDELIDMYNTEVGPNGEIPNLLDQHPGDHLILNSSSFDDGLGAFRPSTSFNDLASLLPATAPSVVSSCDLMMNSMTTLATVPEGSPSSQKRNAADGTKVSEPAQKKRATPKARAIVAAAGRRVPATAPPTAAAPMSSGQAALKLRKEQQAVLQSQADRSVNNTPNPLSGLPAVHVVSAIAVTSPVADAPPAVVSPRPCAVTQADTIPSDAAACVAAAVAAAVSVPMPPPAPISGATEADFKSVAQAAVTNLILNVGVPKSDGAPAASTDSTKVDTSTAHIKALTSSNWVAACTGGLPCEMEESAAAAADSKANRARRQNLTPDERARQNRDRNREHARNTRLRKKAYVEELKRTLTELVAQRDSAELEKRHTAQRELEQREVRFRVMEEFLKLRGRNETSYTRWGAILEEVFTFTLPVTDYRKMIEKDAPEVKTEQVLLGASEAMGDAGHLASFLQTLGSGIEESTVKAPVTVNYQCDRKSFFMDGCNGVIMWTATTVGAVGEGAPMELTLKGNMRAKFSPASNKLVSADIMFDTGNVAAQLQFLDAPKGELNEEIDNCDFAAAAAAAQEAANEADALLDSLQMPQLGSAVPSAINFVSSSDGDMSGANTVSDKDDSSDEGFGDVMLKEFATTPQSEQGNRRSTRRKD